MTGWAAPKRRAIPSRGLLVFAAALLAGLLLLGAALAKGRPRSSQPPSPTVEISSPRMGASYQRGSRILARFRCGERGRAQAIASCRGSVPHGDAINTRSVGLKRFTVTATDKHGRRSSETVHYTVWAYTNPLRALRSLGQRRIDMGVDYSGSGPILALGNGTVIRASNHDAGPSACWGRTCWPGGGIVIYRLSQGPFAGKFVYVAENITVRVEDGQHLKVGQPIATLHDAYPYLEIGWASGRASETLAIADHHQCPCGDAGGWSSIEGRNFDQLLVALGAPSGYLQPNPPQQDMPPGWPRPRWRSLRG